QSVHVRVVVVVSGRAQDEKIATFTFFAKPAKSFIQIASTTEHSDTGSGLGLNVFVVSNAYVLVGAGMGAVSHQRQHQKQQSKSRHCRWSRCSRFLIDLSRHIQLRLPSRIGWA